MSKQQTDPLIIRQYERGKTDALYGLDYGHHNEDKAYPTRPIMKVAYDRGWNAGRLERHPDLAKHNHRTEIPFECECKAEGCHNAEPCRNVGVFTAHLISTGEPVHFCIPCCGAKTLKPSH